jgi:hypothetical protein
MSYGWTLTHWPSEWVTDVSLFVVYIFSMVSRSKRLDKVDQQILSDRLGLSRPFAMQYTPCLIGWWSYRIQEPDLEGGSLWVSWNENRVIVSNRSSIFQISAVTCVACIVLNRAAIQAPSWETRSHTFCIEGKYAGRVAWGGPVIFCKISQQISVIGTPWLM